MNNPGSILKLWVKAVKTHETGKDPKSLPAKGQEQKTKIKQRLTLLKAKGAAVLAAPANAPQFLKVRNQAGKLMTRYCRYLKAAKDEDKKVLPKYLKTVKQLTALVLKLDPGNLSLAEEDPNVNALEAVDVTEVDKALAAPDSGPDSDDDESISEDQGEERAGSEDLTATFKTRLQTLMPAYQNALKAGASNRGGLELAMKLAVAAAKSQDFEQGLTQLDKLQAELGKVKAKATPDPRANLAGTFKMRLQTLMPAFQNALKAGAPNRGGLELAMKLAVAAAKSQDFEQGLTQLDKLQAELGKVNAKRADGIILKQWQAAAQRARFQVRRLQMAIRLIEHPASTDVVDLLDGVVEELETDPASRAEAENLVAYIRTDDVVARAEQPNPFGVEVKIRAPLLAVLESLRDELP